MLLDGYDKQKSISNRLPLPVDILMDAAYGKSISGETVQLYYFANALLTCATAGSTTYTDWVALAATASFEIDINDKTYIITPNFTGDTSMADVASSIQTALQTKIASVTCAYSTDHFVITTAKDESGEEHGNSISVLRNPQTNTGVNLSGSSWMNGAYGSGVITPAILTTDAGQAAGTVVMAKLKYTGILDAFGAMIGNEQDTSLTWTTGTVLPSKYIRRCEYEYIENSKNASLVDIAYELTKGYSSGEWCLDHRSGVIYGKKATTGTSDTAAYKIMSQAGTAVNIDDASFNIATDAVIPAGFLADETSSDSVNEGDIGIARMTLDRRQIIANQVLDDAAFGIGTDYVGAIGCLADETTTDSVTEGDIGIPRMTLNRRQIIAGQTLDDAAFGVGTEYANATGFLADEATTDSVDEGDIGIARMTLDRKQIIANQLLDDSAFGVGTGYVGAIGALADEATPDSVDEGDIGIVRMTLDRQLRVSTAQDTASLSSSTALEASKIAKASAGYIFGFSGYNNKDSSQYIQLHNSATLPADTAVPIVWLKVYANSNFSFEFEKPIYLSSGITICNSSTLATKTIGSADCMFNVVYN